MRERGTALAAALVLLAAGTARADSLEGWLAAGVHGDVEPRAAGLLEARLQYETGRFHGVEAVLEVGADATARELELKDAFLDAKDLVPDVRFRLGRGKKIIGWEYEDARRDRLTLERSLVYRFMQSAALVGRDLFFSARYREYRAAVHYDDLGDAALALSMQSHLYPGLLVGTWVLLQREHYGAFTWVLASGLQLAMGRHRAVAELVAGVDPYQSELVAEYDGGGSVYFAAAKLEYGIALAGFMPYLQAAVLFPDLSHMARDDLQGLVGLRYAITEGLLVAGELEVVGNDPVTLAAGRIWGTPRYRVEVRFFFP